MFTAGSQLTDRGSLKISMGGALVLRGGYLRWTAIHLLAHMRDVFQAFVGGLGRNCPRTHDARNGNPTRQRAHHQQQYKEHQVDRHDRSFRRGPHRQSAPDRYGSSYPGFDGLTMPFRQRRDMPRARLLCLSSDGALEQELNDLLQSNVSLASIALILLSKRRGQRFGSIMLT